MKIQTFPTTMALSKKKKNKNTKKAMPNPTK